MELYLHKRSIEKTKKKKKVTFSQKWSSFVQALKSFFIAPDIVHDITHHTVTVIKRGEAPIHRVIKKIKSFFVKPKKKVKVEKKQIFA